MFCVMSCCPFAVALGADCGEIGSASSKKGFVDFGRSGRPPEVVEEGDRVRVRKGLSEPKLTGNCWLEGEGEAITQKRSVMRRKNYQSLER